MLDKNYYQALTVLDNFLGDWLNHHAVQGEKLLNKHAAAKLTKQQLDHYFNEGNPGHMGYEVIIDKAVSKKDYRFKVWLYKWAMGAQGKTWKRPEPETMDVVYSGDHWRIDNLPNQFTNG